MLPISDSIQMRLVLVLGHFLWQGALIAALLGGIVAIVRVRSPGVRYAASLLSLLLLAACPVITWCCLPEIELPDTAPVAPLAALARDGDASTVVPSLRRRDAASDNAIIPAIELADDGLHLPTRAESSNELARNPILAPTPPASEDPATSHTLATDAGSAAVHQPPAWWQPAAPWIVTVWLIGVAILSLRLLIGTVGTWRWRRRLEPLPQSLVVIVDQFCGLLGMRVPRVALSSRVTEAVAIGLFRPLVLLPTSWATSIPADMLEGILAHELAHIRRYDLWVNLFQRVLETLFFYHLAVWWLSNRLRSERELCCDDLAVSVTQDHVRYAEMLEHVGRMRLSKRLSPVAVSIANPKHALLERVRHVLRAGATDDARGSSVVAAVLLTLAVLVGTILASRTTLPADDAVAQATKLVNDDEPQSSPIAVEPKAPPTANVRNNFVEVTGGYRGRVVTEDGSPLPVDLKLMRRVSSEQTYETTINAKGEFTFNTEPKNGSVRFSMTAKGFAPFDSNWIKLDEPLTLTLSRGAKVRLRLVAPKDGKVVGGTAALNVPWWDEDEQGTFPVDQDGVVTMAHCPKATVKIDLLIPGYEELRIHRWIRGDVSLDVPLVPAKPTRLRVVSAKDGNPIKGAKVRLFSRTRAGSFLTPFQFWDVGPVWGETNADGRVELTTLRAIDPVPTNDPGAAVYAFRIDAPNHAPCYVGDVRAGRDLGEIQVGDALEVRGEVVRDAVKPERISLQVRQTAVAQGGGDGGGNWKSIEPTVVAGKLTFYATGLSAGPFDMFIVYSDANEPANSVRGTIKQLQFHGLLTGSSSNLVITRETVTPGDKHLTARRASLFPIDEHPPSNVPGSAIKQLVGSHQIAIDDTGNATIQENKATLSPLFVWSSTAPVQHSMGHVGWRVFVFQDGTVFIPGSRNSEAGTLHKLPVAELQELKDLLEKHRDLFGKQVPSDLPQFAGWRHGHETMSYTKDGTTKSFDKWYGLEQPSLVGQFDPTEAHKAITDFVSRLMTDAACDGREAKAKYRDLANKALIAALPKATPFTDATWTHIVNETDGTRTIRFADTDEKTEVTLIHPAFGDVYVERIGQFDKRIAFDPAKVDVAASQTVQMTVSEKQPIMVSEPSWLAVTFHSVSDKNVVLRLNGDYRNRLTNPIEEPAESLIVEVVDERGLKVAQPVAGPAMSGVITSDHPIRARGEAAIELFLPQWVTITQPGRYRVMVRCRGKLFPDTGRQYFMETPDTRELTAETTLTVVSANAEKFGELIEEWGRKLVGGKTQETHAEAERAHRMLKVLNDERVVPWYLKLLDQPRSDSKFRACDGLAPYGSDAAFAALKRAMATTGADVHETATGNLAEGSADNIRHTAAIALSKNPHPEAAAFLREQAKDRSSAVRNTVLHFAAKNKSPQARRVIDTMTGDKDERVATEAKRYQKLLADEDAKTLPEKPLPVTPGGKSKDAAAEKVAPLEGVIEAVADNAISFDDGKVITTDAATKYARLTDKGEVLAERKEFKAGLRVRYEVVTGKAATKVVILPAKKEGDGKTSSSENPIRKGSDINIDSYRPQPRTPSTLSPEQVLARLRAEEGRYPHIEFTVERQQRPAVIDRFRDPDVSDEDRESIRFARLNDQSFLDETRIFKRSDKKTDARLVHQETVQGRWWHRLREQTLPDGTPHRDKDLLVLPESRHPLGPHRLFQQGQANEAFSDSLAALKQPIEVLGEELVGQDRCVAIRVRSDQFERRVWLALEKNMLPMRDEFVRLSGGRSSVESLTLVTATREISKGRWFPMEVFSLESTRSLTDLPPLADRDLKVRRHCTVRTVAVDQLIDESLFEKLGKSPNTEPPSPGTPLRQGAVPSAPDDSETTTKREPEQKPNPVQAVQAGMLSVRGRVMIDGAVPEVPPLKLRPSFRGIIPRNEEERVRDRERWEAAPVVEIPDESLVVGKDGAIANVAVYLKKAPKNWKPTEPPKELFELRAEDNHFHSRVSLIRVGQPLRLVNRRKDAVNFHSTPLMSEPFNVVVRPDSTVDTRERNIKAERLPFAVNSDIQPWMKSWLLVLDHPFAAITDAEGRFEIRDLPPGEHHFTVWHERCGYLNKDLVVRVEDDKVTEIHLKFTAEQLERRNTAAAQTPPTNVAAVPEQSNPAVANLIRQFGEQIAKQNFAEAELAAKQANELDPENPKLQRLMLIAMYGRRLAADKDQPKRSSRMTTASIERMMDTPERLKNNDREAAAKLVGRWMLTLPAGFVFDVEIKQTDDGCLSLDGPQQGVLYGKFAVRGDRLELVDPNDKEIDDYVWRVLSLNKLSLVTSKTNNGADYTEAKLERLVR